MATINVDALREYMRDYYGTAMFSGFPVALLDLSDIDSMDPRELCEKAEEMGINLQRFVV